MIKPKESPRLEFFFVFCCKHCAFCMNGSFGISVRILYTQKVKPNFSNTDYLLFKPRHGQFYTVKTVLLPYTKTNLHMGNTRSRYIIHSVRFIGVTAKQVTNISLFKGQHDHLSVGFCMLCMQSSTSSTSYHFLLNTRFIANRGPIALAFSIQWCSSCDPFHYVRCRCSFSHPDRLAAWLAGWLARLYFMCAMFCIWSHLFCSFIQNAVPMKIATFII